MDGHSPNQSLELDTVRLRLNYRGPFDIQLSNGEPLEVSSAKARALLAYLALAPSMRHTREHLAALLWDRSDEERARASLRQVIGTLRKSFGPLSDKILITKNPEFLALEKTRVEIDLPNNDNANEILGEPEFLPNLYVSSEPFEEWRRAFAARLFEKSSKNDGIARGASNGVSKENGAHGEMLAHPDEWGESQPVIPKRKPANRQYALIGLAAILAVGAALIVPNYGRIASAVAEGPDRKPYTHGQDSIEITRQAVARADNPELIEDIEKCEFDRADPAVAVPACTRIIDTLSNDDPYKAIALTIRGAALRWQGEYTQSIEDFSQALLVDPEYHNAHHHIAYSYFLTGDYAQSIEHYKEVIEIFPVHVMSRYRMGEVYFAMKDYKNSEAAFSEALRLAPDFGHAYYYRGKVRIELGKNKAAQQDLRLAAALRPSLRTEAQLSYVDAFRP